MGGAPMCAVHLPGPDRVQSGRGPGRGAGGQASHLRARAVRRDGAVPSIQPEGQLCEPLMEHHHSASIPGPPACHGRVQESVRWWRGHAPRPCSDAQSMCTCECPCVCVCHETMPTCRCACFCIMCVNVPTCVQVNVGCVSWCTWHTGLCWGTLCSVLVLRGGVLLLAQCPRCGSVGLLVCVLSGECHGHHLHEGFEIHQSQRCTRQHQGIVVCVDHVARVDVGPGWSDVGGSAPHLPVLVNVLPVPAMSFLSQGPQGEQSPEHTCFRSVGTLGRGPHSHQPLLGPVATEHVGPTLPSPAHGQSSTSQWPLPTQLCCPCHSCITDGVWAEGGAKCRRSWPGVWDPPRRS